MVAIAIFSADPALCRSLAQLPREDPSIVLIGITDNPSELLGLIDKTHADVVLADTPSREQLTSWRVRHDETAFMLLLDMTEMEDGLVLDADAQAILSRSTSRAKIIAAIKAVTGGFVVLEREVLAALHDQPVVPDGPQTGNDVQPARLTRRELEVLAAMANGASNKSIARRLGISFHTVKFHVASILAKLDADTRTEAVAKAAQSGLVML
jgi:DNA-binding NarL/FixJ family response regulator